MLVFILQPMYLSGQMNSIYRAEEFSSLDKEELEQLVTSESQRLGLEERKKLTKLVKEGQTAQEVLKQIDTRFLPIDQAIEQVAIVQKIKKQNSSSGKALNIAGGLGLILFTIVVLIATERLFYVLPIIGIGMIVKGFFSEKMAYED